MLNSEIALNQHDELMKTIMSFRFNPLPAAWSPAHSRSTVLGGAYLTIRSRAHDFQPFRSHAIGLMIRSYITIIISMFPTNTLHRRASVPMWHGTGPSEASLGSPWKAPCLLSEKIQCFYIHFFHFFSARFARNCLIHTQTCTHFNCLWIYLILPPRLSNVWLKALSGMIRYYQVGRDQNAHTSEFNANNKLPGGETPGPPF